MIEMLKRHEVQVLRRAGHTWKEIAAQTHGDGALHGAFERGLAEQAIGAEYIAHYLDASTPGPPLTRWRTGRRR